MYDKHSDVFSLQVLLMMPKKHSSYNPVFPLLSCEQGVYYNNTKKMRGNHSHIDLKFYIFVREVQIFSPVSHKVNVQELL